MAKLSIFRHAESIYASEIYAGNIDVPLSSKGIKQAFALSIAVSALAPDIVYTSKLVRTTETALLMLANMAKPVIRIDSNELDSVIVAQDFLPLIELDSLNERDYGELQNKNKKEVLQLYSSEDIQHWRRGFYIAPPGGESFSDVVKRVREFLFSNVYPYIENNNILVVAHQNTMRAIYYLLMNQTPEKIESIEFCNCEGIQFDFQNSEIAGFSIFSP